MYIYMITKFKPLFTQKEKIFESNVHKARDMHRSEHRMSMVQAEVQTCDRITFISNIQPNNQRHCLRYFLHLTDTSRAKRDHETDGIDYHFLTKQKFEQDIMAGKFVEHGEFERSIYGTSLESIRTVVETGKICILNLHPQVIMCSAFVTLQVIEQKTRFLFVTCNSQHHSFDIM